MPLGFLTRAMKRKAEEPAPEPARAPKVVKRQNAPRPPVSDDPMPRRVAPKRRRRPRRNTPSGSHAQPIDLTQGDDNDASTATPGAGSSQDTVATTEAEREPKENEHTGGLEEEETERKPLIEDIPLAKEAGTQAGPPETADASTQVYPTQLAPGPRPPTYARDPTYYFADGDLVIRSETTLFRVHRATMGAVEGLFADMLALPQPAAAETVDGVPVFDTFGLASAREMRYLLAVVYGDILPKVMDPRSGRPRVHWDATLALLTVSHRLDLPGMRLIAIDAMETLFPHDPDSYRPEHPMLRGVKREDRPTVHRLIPIQAVNAFRACNLPSMMPVAYYLAAQLPIQDIVNGVVRPDGVREAMGVFDVTRVLEGREQLRASRRSVVYKWLDSITPDGKPKRPCEACENIPSWGGDTCFYYLLRLSLDFNRSGFLDTNTAALEGLPQESRDILKEHLCEHCWPEVEGWMQNGLDENWQKMPSYFGLEDWDRLIETQAGVDSGWDDRR